MRGPVWRPGTRLRNRLALPLLLVLIPGTASAGDAVTAPVDVRALERIEAPPLGLPPVPVAENGPATAAGLRLGRKLFFDRRLSHNGTMSCGMCHIPEQGFTNNELATPTGSQGRSLRRNAPALYNVAYSRHLFHDGRETGLETQAISPLLDPREMANPSIGHLIARIEKLPEYRDLFLQAFGAGPGIEAIGRAIATWERSLVSANSPFDRWYYGNEPDALSAAARRGFRLFSGDAGCSTCHTIGAAHAIFTDGTFHDTGIGYARAAAAPSPSSTTALRVAPGVTLPLSRGALRSVSDPREPDRGRYEVTQDALDLWRFRTPGLRNVALTAPYMHDGSLQTLEQVVRFYNGGGHPHPGLDSAIRPLGLDDAGVAAIVAFLNSLTGDNVAELAADARSAGVGNPAATR